MSMYYEQKHYLLILLTLQLSFIALVHKGHSSFLWLVLLINLGLNKFKCRTNQQLQPKDQHILVTKENLTTSECAVI